MTINAYVTALETLQASLRLYSEQLHDIDFDINMTEIRNWVRLHLVSICKLKVELEMSKIYNAIECLQNDLLETRGIRYEW